MADQSGPVSFTDPYGQLKLVQNPDGTITRIPIFPEVPATGDGVDADVLSKDAPLNAANNTSVRIYRPRNATKGSKLPLIIYYHGSGFIIYSVATPMIHNLCNRIASELPAVIVAVDYRLAPEHRLPAAYEDAVEAVLWVKDQASDQSNCEPWLRDYVDFSNCFIMGCSAGGNMVYQAALRLSKLGPDELQPLKISGLIMNIPFFGGVQRTASELRLQVPLSLPTTDLMWELCLPIGADRDHEYSNPILKGLSESEMEALKRQRIFVRFGGEDLLVDKQKEFMNMLKENGIKLEAHYGEKDYHGIEYQVPDRAEDMLKSIKNFIYFSL